MLYNGQKVITTKELQEKTECNVNFSAYKSSHKTLFEDGKHFYKVKGDSINQSPYNEYILWTEEGIRRLYVLIKKEEVRSKLIELINEYFKEKNIITKDNYKNAEKKINEILNETTDIVAINKNVTILGVEKCDISVNDEIININFFMHDAKLKRFIQISNLFVDLSKNQEISFKMNENNEIEFEISIFNYETYEYLTKAMNLYDLFKRILNNISYHAKELTSIFQEIDKIMDVMEENKM